MKNLLALALVLTSLSSFAGSSRGYLYLNGRDEAAYAGLTDSNETIMFLIDFAKQSGMLKDEHLTSMKKCMAKKETHAILVTTVSKTVPTLYDNGVWGTTQSSSVSEIDCVKAPGFLKFWREQFNMQK